MTDALIIFKPDGAHRLPVRAALWRWLGSQREWRLHGLTWYRPPTELIERHYDFLRGRPFFPWLVEFMTALPVLVGRISASPTALERMRYELGETRIGEARPGSLRERYGIGGGVNILHLSDSPDSGQAEVELWSRYLPLDGIDAQLETSSDRPDWTYRLRSLAGQYQAGVHTELAAREMRQLLREETELPEEDFESLVRVILGAFR
ncbi:MAG TPA: nucleoside-diphosphate kinase [Candidatus Dormibacteraeota bacterium]|nr:nucleoside-diphosphate kinase [Candidatus Dormibacteraeota bacterium]